MKFKVWLKPEAPDEISIRAGEYDRTFLRADSAESGFEVGEAEWRILEPTGYFTPNEPKDKPKPPKKNTKRPPNTLEKAPEAPPVAAEEPEEG